MGIPGVDEGQTKKRFSFRAFSNFAPRLWNTLTPTVRECIFSTVCHRHLKRIIISYPSDEALRWLTAFKCFVFSKHDWITVGLFFFLLCHFGNITAPWASQLCGYWALYKNTIIIIIIIIIMNFQRNMCVAKSDKNILLILSFRFN